MVIKFYPVNKPRTDELLDSLINIWERAVRATHHFLTEQDIQNLIPCCRRVLSVIDLFVVNDNEYPVAFMGILDDKIEMLFVSPDYFRKGIGQRLIRLVIDEYKIRYIDVNEQNSNALALFYKKMGFQVFERTETDELGNPFPILKMKL
ncbi:GNAT family N-acetyltransferase [Bacteroides pyogenes]|uniref:GNAT family N-acetyltransferase n=1 Tax=Bacteroides pyogenes TaxID=310300 RepID=UPI002A92002B|nr:GNAT family N-acetyltransferase [Bacteroides pyogenes]MDY5433822.1 GNAT family N-acetyltransferase [Bacteroides pyogenes]